MIKIEFGDLVIESISDSSGVFSGDNLQYGWKSYIRTDDGFGSLNGDSNNSLNNRSVLVRTTSDDSI